MMDPLLMNGSLGWNSGSPQAWQGATPMGDGISNDTDALARSLGTRPRDASKEQGSNERLLLLLLED